MNSFVVKGGVPLVPEPSGNNGLSWGEGKPVFGRSLELYHSFYHWLFVQAKAWPDKSVPRYQGPEALEE